jgi:hypothetical protein
MTDEMRELLMEEHHLRRSLASLRQEKFGEVRQEWFTATRWLGQRAQDHGYGPSYLRLSEEVNDGDPLLPMWRPREDLVEVRISHDGAFTMFVRAHLSDLPTWAREEITAKRENRANLTGRLLATMVGRARRPEDRDASVPFITMNYSDRSSTVTGTCVETVRVDWST